tara:strand:- start:67 stop:480 length:414 start_codon:yes stop_codon:yes gene_type:complete
LWHHRLEKEPLWAGVLKLPPGINAFQSRVYIRAQDPRKLNWNRIPDLGMDVSFIFAEELPVVWERLQAGVLPVCKAPEPGGLDPPQRHCGIWITNVLAILSILDDPFGSDIALGPAPDGGGINRGEWLIETPDRVPI